MEISDSYAIAYTFNEECNELSTDKRYLVFIGNRETCTRPGILRVLLNTDNFGEALEYAKGALVEVYDFYQIYDQEVRKLINHSIVVDGGYDDSNTNAKEEKAE